MNKTLAISVILSIVGLTQVYSQYIPFIGKDKYWIYINHDNGEPAPRVMSAFIRWLGKDTVINSKNYVTLLSSNLPGRQERQVRVGIMKNLFYLILIYKLVILCLNVIL